MIEYLIWAGIFLVLWEVWFILVIRMVKPHQEDFFEYKQTSMAFGLASAAILAAMYYWKPARFFALGLIIIGLMFWINWLVFGKQLPVAEKKKSKKKSKRKVK